jgi:hypothetical protein
MDPDAATSAVAPASRTKRVSSLLLFLFLSLLFCIAMGQMILFNWDTTVELWIVWTIAWGVIWIVFALLQTRWWARGDEKFWRPIYSWTLLGYIVTSLIFLPVLLWPRFRRWLFRVLKPVDPLGFGLRTSLSALEQLRDEGLLTPEEFESKRSDVLRRI